MNQIRKEAQIKKAIERKTQRNRDRDIHKQTEAVNLRETNLQTGRMTETDTKRLTQI